MIWVAFGRWSSAGRTYCILDRIYWKNWRWTPLVHVRIKDGYSSLPCEACGKEAVMYNHYTRVTQCHACGHQQQRERSTWIVRLMQLRQQYRRMSR